MDAAYAKKLQEKFGLKFQEDAHAEHSTETQIPFIQHYLPQASICEIVYGDINYKILAELIFDVLQDTCNAVVISTDLSHFHSLKDANYLDNSCLEAIAALDSHQMIAGPCEACGKTGVLAALDAAQKMSLQVDLLDYRTSADATYDEKSVVGYMSAVIA
jgi:AmmeMemoRadiSam system protein B